MPKQVIKKGATIKKAGGVSGFKERKGMNREDDKSKLTASSSIADKPMDWLIMPKAFQDATKLPGIPIGYSTCVMGHSNTGKSTLINHAIVAAQRQGIIPVIIDTENSFSFDYAVAMGFKAEPVYGDVDVEVVDPDTGEVTVETRNMAIHWNGDFLYYNNNILIEQYGNYDYGTGKTVDTYRTSAVIEDVSACIDEIIKAQANGEIDQSLLFVWDSIGSLKSYQSYNAKGTGNKAWDAAAISACFEDLIGAKIPGSRKVSSKYTNTFLYVNKVWMDFMSNPVGPATMKPKGGASMTYKARLEIIMGGKLSAGIKKLSATAKGAKYSYGIETKIRVEKNHLDAPYNVTYEGPIIATDKGFVAADQLEEFKKEHVSRILKELQESSKNYEIKAADISYTSESEGGDEE